MYTHKKKQEAATASMEQEKSSKEKCLQQIAAVSLAVGDVDFGCLMLLYSCFMHHLFILFSTTWTICTSHVL